MSRIARIVFGCFVTCGLAACGQSPGKGEVESTAQAVVSVAGDVGQHVRVAITCGEVTHEKVVEVAAKGTLGNVADAYFDNLPAPAACSAKVTVLKGGQPDPQCETKTVPFQTTPGSVAVVSTQLLCLASAPAGANVDVGVKVANGLGTPEFPGGKWGGPCERVLVKLPIIKNNNDAQVISLAPVDPAAPVRVTSVGEGAFQVQCTGAGPAPDGAVPLLATLRQYDKDVATMAFAVHCYDVENSILGQPCSAGVGACAASGHYVCVATSDTPVCSAQPGQPSPEVCDGQDNDCDGVIDQGNPGGGKSCVAGANVCAVGTSQCVAGKIECQASGEQPRTQLSCHDGANAIPNCNGHVTCARGDSSCVADCVRSGSSVCDAGLLSAWCSRVAGDQTSAWYQYHRDWVASHCVGGQVVFVPGPNSNDDNYVCLDPNACQEWSCRTPLVLVMNGHLSVQASAPGARFDLGGTGDGAHYDVPVNGSWLVLDRNHDGQVQPTELFGSGMGAQYSNGFSALAALVDTNSDGIIDRRDPLFGQLAAWDDRNRNWVAEPGELTPLSELGITSLSLTFSAHAEYLPRDNFVGEWGTFRYRDLQGSERTGELLDLHLRVR